MPDEPVDLYVLASKVGAAEGVPTRRLVMVHQGWTGPASGQLEDLTVQHNRV